LVHPDNGLNVKHIEPTTYRARHAKQFFDLENQYASLSEAGDPLEWLNAMIDWDSPPPGAHPHQATQKPGGTQA